MKLCTLNNNTHHDSNKRTRDSMASRKTSTNEEDKHGSDVAVKQQHDCDGYMKLRGTIRKQRRNKKWINTLVQSVLLFGAYYSQHRMACSLQHHQQHDRIPLSSDQEQQHQPHHRSNDSEGTDAKDHGSSSSTRGSRSDQSSEKRDASNSSSSLFLLLCTADGSLYTVDAWTGTYLTKLSTPALIRRATASKASNDDDDDGAGILLPGLDGRLYWQQPSPTTMTEGDMDEDDDEESGSNGSGNNNHNNEPEPVWQPLPLTIHSLLEHPVQSCGEDSDPYIDDCGILSATVETSLLALDENGHLRWETITKSSNTHSSSSSGGGDGTTKYQRTPGAAEGEGERETYGDSSTGREDDEDYIEDSDSRKNDGQTYNEDDETASSSKPSESNVILLLQRKDYRIQSVSRLTGQPSWNVTLGTYQALEFDDVDLNAADTAVLDDDSDDDVFLPTTTGGKYNTDNPRSEKKRQSSGTRNEKGKSQTKDIHLENLPSIVFMKGGRTLVAVHPETLQVAWRLETASVVASVFGIRSGRWTTLQVVHPDDLNEYADANDRRWLALPSSSSTGALQHQKDVAEETVHELLWRQQTTQSPLWWYTQRQQYSEQRQRQLAQQTQQQQYQQQRALPSRPPDPVAHEHQNQCHAHPHGIVDGETLFDECINPNHSSEIPSWMTASSRGPPLSAIASHGGGIFVTWPVVVCLGTVLVFVARFVYLYKKQSWLQQFREQQMQRQEEEDATERKRDKSRSLSLEGGALDAAHRAPLIRSQSLPDTKDLLTQQWHDRKSKGTPTTPGLVSSSVHPDMGAGLNRGNMSADKSAFTNTDANTSSALISAVPTTTLFGGIPLVRYSRYASEFEQIARLGKGGFGTVFHCKNVLDGRDYAIKKVVLSGKGHDDSKFQSRLERVLREVKSLAVLDHTHIVRYYTAWLELDRDPLDGDVEESVSAVIGDDDTWSSNRYSSSIVTESGSQWTQPSSVAWKKRGGYAMSSSFSSRRNNTQFQRYARFLNDDDDDIGFIFEESTRENERNETEGEGSGRMSNSTATAKQGTASIHGKSNDDKHSLPPDSLLSPASKVESINEKEPSRLQNNDNKFDDTTRDDHEQKIKSKEKIHRHTLYIQMQLCSQKTLQDFLSSRAKLDINHSLQLFLQIVQAVQHVHEQGLIHRDLKPCNVFLVDGVVKVGDFGLSRESSVTATQEEQDADDNLKGDIGCGFLYGDDHTAGVGTRSYASPEQMNGSDYDSSTDIFSLGIILFELCYRMTTTMERNICLTRLRQNCFPDDWDSLVGTSFPTLKGLITSMVSTTPSNRPSAFSVAQHVQSLNRDFSVLDGRSFQGRSDVLLLRVEAAHKGDVLGRTLSAIMGASYVLTSGDLNEDHEEKKQGPHNGDAVQVLQYGLYSSDEVSPSSNDKKPAIMEFALKFQGSGSALVSKLLEHPEIYKVRQVHTQNS